MTIVENETGTHGPFEADRFRTLLEKLSGTLTISADKMDSLVHDIEASLPESLLFNQLIELAAESVALRTIINPDCGLLAGRLEAYRIRRLVPKRFSEAFRTLRLNHHTRTRQPYPLVSKAAAEIVESNADYLDSLVCPERDFDLSYFGVRTLQKSFLLHIDKVVAETPQYLFLRVAVGIHGIHGDADMLARIKETYDLMSSKYMIHSSPTLFNAGTDNNFLSLCYLMATEDDSIDGIYKTLHKAAMISKGSGGIGIHVSNVRACGALIKASNGTSGGLVPMLRVFNNTARYVDQGGNKRPGAMAVYLEPWHADVQEVLELRKNHGQEELRARDLFYALWIPDLFMKRVKENEDWSLFSPDEAPGLNDVFGQEFEDKYTLYERQGLAMQTIKARKLWMQILESQTETGMPFMLYKDSCNRKLNQKNLGTIKSSNLCCEIVEYSSPEEIAVCNLGLLALPSFVNAGHENGIYFDFPKLHQVTKVLARNLDKVIDVTKYPVDISETSNKRHRPIAIGVQGLADTFLELRLPFESEKARKLNSQIFETIYHAAVECSVEMAIEKGAYESFEGSPASMGKLQFDLWNHKPRFFDDWDVLKERVKIYGLRNSLLVAPMPTATTSQILGFNECFEPFTSNLYLRRVLSGEFQVVNKYLVKDLEDMGIWSDALKNAIIKDNGLIQKIDIIPSEIKELYKTVWEISQKVVVQLAADRGRFIDQLQSMNIHLQNPTFKTLTSCHFYAWEQGLKTGMYYLRTQAASRAIQFTIDEAKIKASLDSITGKKIASLKRREYIEANGYPKKEAGQTSQEFYKRLAESTPCSITSYESDKERDMLLKHAISRSHKKRRKVVNGDRNGENQDETYDIYDETPLSCNISDVEGCEACSG
ncbi:CIC11C00000004480 [Sungouiella intermedia]|uniref:Ribonucleoside-diphosphate reductase n=1 Tax=Sungouiella intermedia TaxID=45354 RepID=A0A1L0BZV3_9ASCO|nr:CIC11C00000004480 [[Candida] intermedia]